VTCFLWLRHFVSPYAADPPRNTVLDETSESEPSTLSWSHGIRVSRTPETQ
jgi:hypothetical protein